MCRRLDTGTRATSRRPRPGCRTAIRRPRRRSQPPAASAGWRLAAGLSAPAFPARDCGRPGDRPEETKLARICIGDRVEAKLLGYEQLILGYVTTVTRGIGVSDAAGGKQRLPNVNPVYTWIRRLAQRVPVRIAIDNVPPGIPAMPMAAPGSPARSRPPRPGIPTCSMVRRPGQNAFSDHNRARDTGITSSRQAELRPQPGADQPGSRTGRGRIAAKQEDEAQLDLKDQRNASQSWLDCSSNLAGRA